MCFASVIPISAPILRAISGAKSLQCENRWSLDHVNDGIGIEHVIRMQLTNTHTHDAADDNQYGIDFTNEAVDNTEETDETNKKSNAATFKVEESSIDVDDI